MATSKDWRFLGAVTAAMTMTVAVLALSLAAPGPAAAGAFGEVDIEQVAEPAEFPYSTACFLRSTLNSGPEVLCSGVLIGPYHVLRELTFTMPDDAPVGTWWMALVVDSNNGIAEHVEDDQIQVCSTQLIIQPAGTGDDDDDAADDDDASGDDDDTSSDGCECAAARPSVSITPPLAAWIASGLLLALYRRRQRR